MKIKSLVYALGEENRPVGTEFEIDKEAGEKLIEAGLAEEVKPARKPAPKKTGKQEVK
jgi:hypothetical protein